MNRVGRYLRFAVFVAFAACAVAANLDAFRDFLQHPLDSFLKRPLISQIIIGFVIWLILVIVPWFIYSYLFKQREEGAEFWALAYLII